MCDNDDKLIPAHTVTGAFNPRYPLQAVGNRLQKHISVLMSKSIIDMFKIIKVNI